MTMFCKCKSFFFISTFYRRGSGGGGRRGRTPTPFCAKFFKKSPKLSKNISGASSRTPCAHPFSNPGSAPVLCHHALSPHLHVIISTSFISSIFFIVLQCHLKENIGAKYDFNSYKAELFCINHGDQRFFFILKSS